MLIAFTGAGISAASGIPTFQDQPGIRDKLTRSFADAHPDEYKAVLDGMRRACLDAKPNDAHMALAEYAVPVITMNVDGLHTVAGSTDVLEIHGSIRTGNVVLYGDPAPLYQEAESLVYRLSRQDVLLIVGTSYYTGISSRLHDIAKRNGATIVEINQEAEARVRPTLDKYAYAIENRASFIARTDAEANTPPVPLPYAGGWEMP